MLFLPICVNIEDQEILVVGGGKAAFHKLHSLLKYTRDITVIAPHFSSEVLALEIHHIHKEFSMKDLDNCMLVYAATDDEGLNESIYQEAKMRGILVNVCDNPGLSTFVSPAIYKQDNMSVAVSSNAVDVKKSIKWRNDIREQFNRD